jgi:hypothetical protein
VKDLFQTLCDKAIVAGDGINSNWRKVLPSRYHIFSGDYHGFQGKHGSTFRFVDNMYPITLKLAPPLGGRVVRASWWIVATSVAYYISVSPFAAQGPSFFAQEGYAKHLIGNSFQIATVEILLRPLKAIFPSKAYPNFDYSFAWKPKAATHAFRSAPISAAIADESEGASTSASPSVVLRHGSKLASSSNHNRANDASSGFNQPLEGHDDPSAERRSVSTPPLWETEPSFEATSRNEGIEEFDI